MANRTGRGTFRKGDPRINRGGRPAGTSITALLNAASAIGLALTTDVLLTELKEQKGDENPLVAGAVS